MIKRGILQLASRFGQGQRLIEIYSKLDGNPYDLHVGQDIHNFDISPSEQKGIVLFPVIEGDVFNIFRLSVLAHKFRIKGYKPVFIICYNDLGFCVRRGQLPDNMATCELCFHGAKHTLEEFGIPHVRISDVLAPDRVTDNYPGDGRPVEHRDISISDFASASTRKVLKKHRIRFNSPEEIRIYKRFLSTSEYLVEAAYELYEKFEPSAVLGHHPMYIYGGIFLEVAHILDIPSYSVGIGYQDKHLLFGSPKNRSSLPQFENDNFISTLLDSELTPQEREATRDVMQKRMRGDASAIDYVQTASESLTADSDEIMVGIFTNLMWDASIETNNPLFKNPYDWLVSTIDWFKNRSQFRVVIKPHPAEEIIGTSRGVVEEISARFDSLPANIELLSPDTNVNQYKLLENLDVGIVWNSTIGLEMAFSGKPVIVSGETHYRGHGLTFDPDTIEAYFSYLNDIGDLTMDKEMMTAAERYVHYLFFRKQIPFPYFETHNDALGGRSLPISHQEISEDELLDFVIEQMLENKPIVLPRELSH